MEEPVDVLAEDVTDKLREHASLTQAQLSSVRSIVEEFTEFDKVHSVPGYSRVILKKDDAWLPRTGKSIKPGNLRFNLGKLFESAVSGAGVYFTAVTQPIFAIFVGLVALKSLVDSASIDLDEGEAWVLWASWIGSQKVGANETADILATLRLEAKRLGSDIDMTLSEAEAKLRRLQDIGAVRRESDGWVVIETVQVVTE
ncbi:MAG: hypothetical protein ACR2PC_07915 [Tsuneonella suprasediminis]